MAAFENLALLRAFVGIVESGSISAGGETDKAFEWLQISLDNHDSGLLSLLIDPLMRGLHHDSRYSEMLAKVGLPPFEEVAINIPSVTPQKLSRSQ